MLCIALSLPGALSAQEAVERSFAVALVRDVIAAVNHGNWTGNYTVLRDIAAREFAEPNDATLLAARFVEMRAAGIDMLPAMVTEPVILQAQVADGQNQMRLTGYFPLQPQHVSFDLVFQLEGPRWLLRDMSIGGFDPIPAPAPEATPTPESEPATPDGTDPGQ